MTLARAFDDISRPAHYCAGSVESIDAIETVLESNSLSGVEGYLVGSTMKYLWRFKSKHDNPLDDLHKARWYLERLISKYEGKS